MPPNPLQPAVGALSPRAMAVLLALSAALLLFRLGAVPLLGPDEPRYARVAVEMHRSGDHVTPTLQGRPWLEKPALYYWLAGAAFSLFGETETAARLPSVASGLLFTCATALFGARLYGSRAGLCAGFVLATSLLPFAYSRAAAMDMLLAATVTVATGLAGLRVLGIAGRLAIPTAFAFMGLATLAKGPLGVLLPGLVVAGYLLAARDRSLWREVLSPVAVAIFLLVAAPWYVLVTLAQGRSFLEVFLLNQNLERFTSTVHHHPGPLLYYIPVVVAGLFPWSGLVLPGLAGLHPRRSKADLFLLLWLLLPLVFFSLAGAKLPGYILPCLCPLALLMGRAAAQWLEGSTAADRSWGTPRAAGMLGVLLGALFAATPAWLLRIRDPDWALALPCGLWALIVSFGAARRLGRDPVGALRLLRVGGAGLLLLLALAAPPVLARQESGRKLLLPAMGREVLAWGAWRTAWMAGYFYNDGKVREVGGLKEVMEAAAGGPVLVLAGPAERRQLEGIPSLATHLLAEGVRGNVLLRVELR
ncbi:MAG TPA: glycosyltransferase family 39 protein [Vicinamibacteria bacterium]|jgi:4-amino-4-deoxy-L-arabinose transferase-like glycosyltransferase|nr:glycosyltransferase family 39 protein [Vicinamibacteria bacterium]